MTTTDTSPDSRRHVTACSEAIGHLEWFHIPHSIEQVCTAIRGMASDEARLARSLGSGGPGGSGHSDPTVDAALAAVSAGDGPDAARTLLGALATVEEATADVLGVLGHLSGPHPTQPNHRLSTTIAGLHRIDDQLRQLADDPACSEQVTWALEQIPGEITDTARWMRTKAEALWKATPARHRDRQLQPKTRRTCEICTTLGRDVVPERGERCERCKDFIARNKGLRPTAKIARWWEDHPRLDVPLRLILEARVEAAETRRKRSA